MSVGELQIENTSLQTQLTNQEEASTANGNHQQRVRPSGLQLISISQFAAWVQQATDDIAKLPISWQHVLRFLRCCSHLVYYTACLQRS